MNIQELKSKLDIVEIGRELGLQIGKNGSCLCPFHKDKKPSLFFSKEKQLATCFSGNCDAGSMDVIALVQKFYSWELPKVLEWLQPYAGMAQTPKTKTAAPIKSVINYQQLFKKLQPKLGQSSKARDYLTGRHLDYKTLEAAFNNGKDHPSLKYCVIFPLKIKAHRSYHCMAEAFTAMPKTNITILKTDRDYIRVIPEKTPKKSSLSKV
ncbi:MAG: hypothetical protein GKR88_04550 [Flavobacteriaceae bacterium]|nr:MAG: hypothetical protein GKR88_04550 [Flavobacteriaceae bacterium]